MSRRRVLRQSGGAELSEKHILDPGLAGEGTLPHTESEASQLQPVADAGQPEGGAVMCGSRIEHLENSEYASLWDHKHAEQVELAIEHDSRENWRNE